MANRRTTAGKMSRVLRFRMGSASHEGGRLSEQIDIAVDLGVVPPPLPEILTLRQLVETAPAAPPQVIEGVLHVGGHPEG